MRLPSECETGLHAVRLEMPDADVTLYPAFFDKDAADSRFEHLQSDIDWQQKRILMFGKLLDMPRLTAWYGDAGAIYTYSGITEYPLPWTDGLLAIRREVEAAAETTFNSVLLNYYRGGQDSMGWHSDDEPELGTNPTIASVSFGAARRFQFKHRRNPELRSEVDLTPGSLLLMRGPTQTHWKHQVPKSSRILGPRINLTFRRIY